MGADADGVDVVAGGHGHPQLPVPGYGVGRGRAVENRSPDVVVAGIVVTVVEGRGCRAIRPQEGVGDARGVVVAAVAVAAGGVLVRAAAADVRVEDLDHQPPQA